MVVVRNQMFVSAILDGLSMQLDQIVYQDAADLVLTVFVVLLILVNVTEDTSPIITIRLSKPFDFKYFYLTYSPLITLDVLHIAPTVVQMEYALPLIFAFVILVL